MSISHFVWLSAGMLTIASLLGTAVVFLIRISIQFGRHFQMFSTHIQDTSIHRKEGK